MKKTAQKDYRINVEKKVLINLLSLLVGVALFVFAGSYYFLHDALLMNMFFWMGIGVIVNFLIYRRYHIDTIAFYYLASFPLPILAIWQQTGGIGGTGIYYFYLYLIFIFFLLGKVSGLVLTTISLFLSVLEFFFQQLGYLHTFYSPATMAVFYFGYLIDTGLIYIYQISKEKAQAALKKQTDVLTVQDAEMKRQTVALKEDNAKNDAILESVGDGLVAFDTKGRVMFMNESVHRLLGWNKKELLGKVWTDVVKLQDVQGKTVPHEKLPFTLVIKKGEKLNTGFKYVYRRKNNIPLPVSITISPIVSDGKTIGAIEAFRDITKERDVDRMKTEFISLASHQLRTPLSAIKWNLEMLLAGDAGKLSKDQFDMTKNVDESNERMISLVNSLLNVSRIESGRIIVEPQMTKLGDLVQGVIQEVQQKVNEKKQKLVLSVNKDLPAINIDQQLVRQVYINLLTNAIKYTPNGGEITVIISENEKEIISQVSDNGYGIPAKDKGKVFQKFYRGDNITKIITDGNGLGMYLVKAIITSSRGKIWFESHTPDEKGLRPGKQGTTFWFTLPKSGMTAKKGEVTLDA